MHKIFITGTDTNIGKTYVTVKLLEQFNQKGFKTIGLKPVATGCINNYNQDALLLQQHASVQIDYQLINPFNFIPPVSPNIACDHLNITKIYSALKEAFKIQANICLIEGVGGWFTPLNFKETMADLVQKIENIEIILVVGIRLGCLNHSLLTYHAIKTAKLNLVGWIANIIDPEMEALQENITTLRNYIKEPCLEIFKYEDNRQST